jgi:hypothetical protein
LEAIEHDQHIGDPIFVNLMQYQAPPYPKLEALTITGRNCYMLSRDVTWTDRIAGVTELTISQFTPQPGESFTLRDLMLPIAMMHALRTLNIYNVNVDISGEPLMSLGSTQLCLNLHDMPDFSVITAMANFLQPWALHLTDCSAGAAVGGFGDFRYGGDLQLIIIKENLGPLLQSWDGDTLEIFDCLTFTDAIIDLMCVQLNPGEFLCAPQMTTLGMKTQSPATLNVSVAALKRLVEIRNAHKDTRLESLWIHTNALDISEEDRAWFAARVDEFDYR